MKDVTIKKGIEIALDCSPWLRMTEEDQKKKEEAENREWADLEELRKNLKDYKRFRHRPSDFMSDNVTMINIMPSNKSSFQDWLFNHLFGKYLEVKDANRKNEKETENRFNTGRLRNPS